MKCEKCDGELVIDDWNGWVWTCLFCDTEYRKATNEEIEEWEETLERILKKD